MCFLYEGRIDSIDCQEIVNFFKGTRRLFCIRSILWKRALRIMDLIIIITTSCSWYIVRLLFDNSILLFMQTKRNHCNSNINIWSEYNRQWDLLTSPITKSTMNIDKDISLLRPIVINISSSSKVSCKIFDHLKQCNFILTVI